MLFKSTIKLVPDSTKEASALVSIESRNGFPLWAATTMKGWDLCSRGTQLMCEDITENIRIVSIVLSAVLQLCYEGS